MIIFHLYSLFFIINLATEYKDESPGFFSDVDPFERDVISLIRNDTNRTISFEKFVNLMK